MNDSVARLPVRPSLGHFFEAGLSKRVFSVARVDVTQYERRMNDFADDDVLLNTGVSVPIAFDGAQIRGTELKVEIPRWGAWSGFASYSFMRGTGFLPITGGLLLGDDAASALRSTNAFPISQDQRHTMRGRVAYQLSDRAWLAMAASYGSGLPVEFSGDPAQALEQYGPRIISQVDFETGRVRPSASLDAAFSLALFKTDRQQVRLQVNAVNLTDRLNVINFAGLFSGTALAPPRRPERPASLRSASPSFGQVGRFAADASRSEFQYTGEGCLDEALAPKRRSREDGDRSRTVSLLQGNDEQDKHEQRDDDRGRREGDRRATAR